MEKSYPRPAKRREVAFEDCLWLERRLRMERKIESTEARDTMPQRLGRLTAMRENPVSSIENQTA